MDKMIEKLKEIEKKIKERRQSKSLQPCAGDQQLPMWQDYQRGAPVCVLRSSIFGVVKRGRRRYLRREELAKWGEDKISYSGERLDQADLDVWLELLHLVRTTPLGQTVAFEKYTFLRQLGRSTGRQNWRWLEDSIARMMASTVEIKTGTKRYLGALIHKGYIDDESGRYVVILNTELMALFHAGYTLQHAKKRLLLSTDLAKWLCGYLESHKATEDHPHRVSVKRLHELCGSETKNLKHFRSKLKSAVDQLAEQEVIKKWTITKNDILETVKF
ncbi:MAG: hypothetical protein GXP14_04545 [Gammaproteobacteria bacterium]|nr:hypothetical protein [Gammaproteobacteria bacterium]